MPSNRSIEDRKLRMMLKSDPSGMAEQLDREICERSLLEFIKRGWHVLHPDAADDPKKHGFKAGWAIEAICEHLEAVTSGEIRKLLINVPPGCTKSMAVNVFWPAWEWGPQRRPSTRYISASYSADLSMRDNLYCRQLIESEWYQGHWGDVFNWAPAQNAKSYYQNDRMGSRFSTSVGGSLTGYRGDRLIVDDPHNVKESESEKKRVEAVRWFGETLPSRKTNQDSAFIVIMQRLHVDDVSGFILKEDNELGYEHLCLPMEHDLEHPHPSTRFEDPRTEDGELLWPERFGKKEVEETKRSFRAAGGSYAEAGQFQQRPVPRGGGMFKDDWLEVIDEPLAPIVKSCRGWDLAATKKSTAAFSAGVRMGMDLEGNIYIQDVRRIQGTAGQVEKLLKRCAKLDGKDIPIDIPQDPGQAGKSQISYLLRQLHGYIVNHSPESGSKEDRARPLAAQAEAGNVYLIRGEWNAAFIAEACLFPNSTFKDQVDAATRAYSRLLVGRERTIGSGPVAIGG